MKFPAIFRKASRRQVSRARTSAIESLEKRTMLSTVTIDPLANVNVPGNKSLIIPVTATDSAGNPITYTASSDNPNVSVQVHTGNTFFQVTVAGFGTMTFELFHDIAPQTVDRLTTLINSGFYNGLTFHRIKKNFVIQGGDPSGDGSGGSGVDIPNEENFNALFDGNGQLAMARSSWDTNDSQFFITQGPQRFLDLHYTLFGQLIRGFDVLNAISNVPVVDNGQGEVSKPVTAPVMSSVTMITDTADTVITVSANGLPTGTVTIHGDDGQGGVSTRTFTATGVDDTANNEPPILTAVNPNPTTPLNTPLTLPISGIDLENDPLEAVTIGAPFPTGIDNLTTSGANVIVTPTPGFSGTVQFPVTLSGAANRANLNSGDIVTIHLTIGSTQPAVLANNVLTITGTSGLDSITITTDGTTITTNVDSVIQTFPSNQVFQIAVNALEGDDEISLGAGIVASTLNGNAGNDTIIGSDGNDVINAGQGNDSLTGLNGDDTITGAKGDDTLAGGIGNDSLGGGQGNDSIMGGQGNDSLIGGLGNNFLVGAMGDDTFFAHNGLADTIRGGQGTDSLQKDNGIDTDILNIEVNL